GGILPGGPALPGGGPLSGWRGGSRRDAPGAVPDGGGGEVGPHLGDVGEALLARAGEAGVGPAGREGALGEPDGVLLLDVDDDAEADAVVKSEERRVGKGGRARGVGGRVVARV